MRVRFRTATTGSETHQANEAANRGVRSHRHGARQVRRSARPDPTRHLSESKQWIWRGTIRGRRRDLGLGGYPCTSLAEARQTAIEYRKLARQSGGPTALRRDTTAPSFAEACEQVITMHEPSWKDGGRAADSWRSTLSQLAYPRLDDMPVSEITSEDVLAVVAPVWQTRRGTARKLKGRISAVMAWSIAEGHRPDDPISMAQQSAAERSPA